MIGQLLTRSRPSFWLPLTAASKNNRNKVLNKINGRRTALMKTASYSCPPLLHYYSGGNDSAQLIVIIIKYMEGCAGDDAMGDGSGAWCTHHDELLFEMFDTSTCTSSIECRVFVTPVGDTVVYVQSNKYSNWLAHERSVCLFERSVQSGGHFWRIPDTPTHKHTYMSCIRYRLALWNEMRWDEQNDRIVWTEPICERARCLHCILLRSTYLWMIISVSIVWLNAYVTFDAITERSSQVAWMVSLLNLRLHTQKEAEPTGLINSIIHVLFEVWLHVTPTEFKSNAKLSKRNQTHSFVAII